MPAAPFISDHALSARLEGVEAAQLASLVRTVAARLPSLGAAYAEIAGGVAAFLAPHISVSRAAGLGMSGPVSSSDVEALERFYHDRDTEVRLLVSPFAHATLFEHLGERGFRLAWLDTILTRRIQPEDRFVEAPPAGIDITVAAPGDASAWVAASLEAFGTASDEERRARTAIFEAGFATEGLTHFIASCGGAIAGTGAVQIHERAAYLFAASTAPAYRGRGVQGALIRARLDLACAAGCDLAFSGTEAGSGSQRNFERMGFSVVYSQALMMKPLPPPA